MSASAAVAPLLFPEQAAQGGQGRFPDVDAMRAYTTAGRAILTLQSERSGAHYTYRVARGAAQAGSAGQPPTFINLLVPGAEPSYLGILGHVGIRLTKQSRLPAHALPVRAFDFFWSHIAARREPPAMQVRHEGRCGRCARVLTHPVSLLTGIGPECAGLLGCD